MELLRTDYGVSIRSAGGSVVPIRHIIGIGRNYAEHAKEQGAKVPDRPMIFSKNPAALSLSGDPIRVPKICQDREQMDFEGELGVVIGWRGCGSGAREARESFARDVSPERALDHVLGYVVANDVSARWWQKEGSGGQFNRGKGFDSFCPIGPRIVPASEITDPQNLRLVTRVNAQEMQSGNTSQMIFSVAALIADLSRGTTLLPGTLILTGTPSGVGMARNPPVWLKDGDRVEIEIEKVGTLVNVVRFEP